MIDFLGIERAINGEYTNFEYDPTAKPKNTERIVLNFEQEKLVGQNTEAAKHGIRRLLKTTDRKARVFGNAGLSLSGNMLFIPM